MGSSFVRPGVDGTRPYREPRLSAGSDLAHLALRTTAAHGGRSAPGDQQDRRAGRVLVRRVVVDGVRDAGDHDRSSRWLAASALSFIFPIAIAIVFLLTIVTISYEQTIHAYPSGGGAYIVARDNLGEFAAQVAGASLLMDYILTVAVSVSSGVAQITSAFPALFRPSCRDCRSCSSRS